jgi:hypothetical protein
VLQLVRDEAEAPVLRRDTELRLVNQIERAFVQRFGAEQGLRLLVRLATTQMLKAGNSRAAVRTNLRRLVKERLNRAPEMCRQNASRAAELTTLMLDWSDRTAPEHTA